MMAGLRGAVWGGRWEGARGGGAGAGGVGWLRAVGCVIGAGGGGGGGWRALLGGGGWDRERCAVLFVVAGPGGWVGCGRCGAVGVGC